MNRWNILYRGSLSSCNYSCDYCPFAKTVNTKAELQQDATELNRFVDWVAATNRPIGVLFTPWGEAIVHGYYRQAMVRLSRLPHVERVALQTNLSGRLDALAEADSDTLALWATYHPGEVSMCRFLEKCAVLDAMQIRYSVGVVGLREHFDQIDQIEQLRAALDPRVYLWINAFKRDPNYYSAEESQRLQTVDPYFEFNRHYYPSQGKSCFAGNTTFTVDAMGDVRRCHFIDDCLGNIYRDTLADILAPQACTNATCGCHIGYVHRPELKLYELFGDNVLERIPRCWPRETGSVV